MERNDFAAGVIDRYERLKSRPIVAAAGRSKSVGSYGVTTPPVGHPEFASLGIGETGVCELAVAFVDMRAMTARSFWQPLETVTHLSLAVLGQVAEVVQESGGHVLGLRGDGLMAGWGDQWSDASTDVYLAAAACAFSLDAVQGAVNEVLAMSGIEPVQLCAGADWGPVCFARTGTPEASEVNVVGHPANFAAKCEKQALSWEIVVGEGAADHITNQALLTRHPASPKTYQHRDQRRSYAFYQLAWREIVSAASTAIAQVGGSPASSVRYTF